MGETRAKMARGSARSRRSFPGTLPQRNFEWVQHPAARGQGRCRVDWYPIRAVERDKHRHRRQWHMRQCKPQAVAVAQASKAAADEVGVDARVEAHLLPPTSNQVRKEHGPRNTRLRSGLYIDNAQGAPRRDEQNPLGGDPTRDYVLSSDGSRRRNKTGGVHERPVAAAAALGRLVRRGRRPLRERQRRWQRRKRQWHTSHAKQNQGDGTDTARPRRRGLNSPAR